jgi:hypothetical protein
MLDQQGAGGDLMAALLAKNRGLPVDEFGLRVLASAFGSAITIAIDQWQKDDGKSDLLALIDQAIDSLAEGLRELGPEPQA